MTRVHRHAARGCTGHWGSPSTSVRESSDGCPPRKARGRQGPSPLPPLPRLSWGVPKQGRSPRYDPRHPHQWYRREQEKEPRRTAVICSWDQRNDDLFPAARLSNGKKTEGHQDSLPLTPRGLLYSEPMIVSPKGAELSSAHKIL